MIVGGATPVCAQCAAPPSHCNGHRDSVTVLLAKEGS